MKKSNSLNHLIGYKEEQIKKLNKSGLLKTDTYKIGGEFRPNPLSNPDFGPLVKLCENYLDSKQYSGIKNIEKCMSEELIHCIYGCGSGFWYFTQHK
jgi:hypothetical protein